MPESPCLDSFICLYPSVRRTAKASGKPNNHILTLFIIHTLLQSCDTINREYVARHTFLYRPIVLTHVRYLISYGYLEPLEKPRNYLILTPLGLSIIDSILLEYNKALSILRNGPPILNKPKPRKK